MSLLLVLAGACDGGPEVQRWAADRGAGELLLLDGELCVSRRVPMPSPRLLAGARDALWVGAAERGSDELPTLLVRVEPGRAGQRTSPFDGIVELYAEETGDVLVIERAGSSTRLWRVDAQLSRTLLGRFPAASALAERGGEVLIGASDGSLVRLTETGGMDAAGHWVGPVHALAPGPRAGEWWVLGGRDGTNVGLIDAELEPRWIAETSLRTRGFAPVSGAECVWLADGAAAQRYGPGGALEASYPLQVGETPWRAVAAADTGVVLLAEGALIELRLRGAEVQPVRSQGGFHALSALVRVP